MVNNWVTGNWFKIYIIYINNKLTIIICMIVSVPLPHDYDTLLKNLSLVPSKGN